MDNLFDIFKIILPAGFVLATAYFLVKNFLDDQSKKRQDEIKQANQSLITPIRLQAYERMALFLERISPNNLVMRVHKNGMSALLLQAELVKTIRSEFEHNLSQQIYISNNSWQLIKNAKEEIIKLVNISASKVPDTGTGIELAQVILQIGAQVKKMPTEVAMEYIKKEISQTF